MRSCASLTRQLRLWGGSTSALGGRLLLSHHLLWLTVLGRWDTPQHTLVDDPEEGEEPIWPGDAEVQSFHTNKALMT